MTAGQIRDFYHNLKQINAKEKMALSNLMNFLDEVESHLFSRLSNENLRKLNDHDLLFWSEIALIRIQTTGLLFGYNSRVPKDQQLTMKEMFFINADGQIPELLSIFEINNDFQIFRLIEDDKSSHKEFDPEALFSAFGTRDPENLWNKIMAKSHCSAFMKLLRGEDNKIKDLLLAHSTWDDYSAMIRIFKHYDYGVKDLETNQEKRTKISFSSYPGCLTSTDDFYIINGNLFVMETSLEVLNRHSYKVLPSSEYVPDYMRILSANRNSASPHEWVSWMQKVNTGTYNTQWMVVDLEKVRNSQTKLQKNTFLLAEQVPGTLFVKDLSEKLSNDGYWAAFNVAFLAESRKILGYEDMGQRAGFHSFNFKTNRRSLMFQYFQNQVQDIDSLKRLMEFNPWDPSVTYNIELLPFQGVNNPVTGIAARYDLSPDKNLRKNTGAIDTKITNLEMSKTQACEGISGPTHQNQPIFSWSTAKDNDPKDGLPDLWDFDWVELRPEGKDD